MSGLEREYVAEAFTSNWLSTVGPNLNAFEEELKAYFGNHVAAVSSGTAAIHLGLRVLGIGPTDEVLCQSLTFVASANPILYQGARPIFLDSERTTWHLDPQLLADALKAKAKVNRLPKAVVVVHLFGHCADMESILSICEEYDVPVLEDAAEAMGATFKGRAAGTWGHVAAFSFNGNKIITTTGGGALVSPVSEWIEKAKFWAGQARDAGLGYRHSECGYNYRLSNVLAGIGRGQLRVLGLRVSQRREVAWRYERSLADVPGFTIMPRSPLAEPTNWLSVFLVDEQRFGCSRDALIARLDRANIESRPVWKPMHLQPLFDGFECYGGKVAEGLFRQGICLPSSSSLSEEDQLRVVNCIRNAAKLPALTAFTK